VRLGVAPRVRDGVAGVDPFTLLHFVGWGALAFAAVLVVGRMRWVPAVAGVMIAASIVIEVLQETRTLLRAYELSDVVANTAGVVAGSFAALSVLAALDRRRRSVRAGS
jgi:VanZ family protein